MTRRTTALFLLLATVPFAAACLVKDTTHRLYLAPNGALQWSVLERDVRSSDGTPSERWREEQSFLDGIHSGAHPILEALRRLDPDEASVQVTRSERPYAASTEARFQRVDVVVQKLLGELRIPGSATLTHRADETTLTVSIDLSAIDDRGDDLDTPVVALLEDLDRYRIVLTEGRFVSALGFEIVDDGTAVEAKPEQVPVDRPAVLRLTWKR
jgi:hypothetical protein